MTRPATWRDRLEYLPIQALASLFGALPIDVASAIGGAIGRHLGPLLPPTRRARKNLALVLPELAAEGHARIIREMWDNLGRVIAEYPHLPGLAGEVAERRIEIVGQEHLLSLHRAGRPALLASAHCGNWEVSAAGARLRGVGLVNVYRAIENPLIDRYILDLRRTLVAEMVAKGAGGGRALVAALRAGRTVGMLVDQKLNDGIAVPFFGIPAMTAPALAELAIRYKCPIVPAVVQRLKGAHFRLLVEPPIIPPQSGDRQRDVLDLMTAVNARIEAWVRAAPGQWFWLHRRWPAS